MVIYYNFISRFSSPNPFKKLQTFRSLNPFTWIIKNDTDENFLREACVIKIPLLRMWSVPSGLADFQSKGTGGREPEGYFQVEKIVYFTL